MRLERTMQLGNFSVSLAVKDIAKSRDFYEKLGFRVVGGNQDHKWLVLQNDQSTIGLFQGMFDRNMLTYNPGWTRDSKPSDAAAGPFTDVRDIQQSLLARGIAITTTTEANATGPAHIVLTDPDGNPILIDQHVPAPKP
jgi:catechol 2,3-dioxygenase-like lactoylglutathione lyase family enzyme